MSKYNGIKNSLKAKLSEIKDSGLYKKERIITSPQAAGITVNNKNFVNFCSNNYLGLCNNEELLKYAQKSVIDNGFGLSSVRFICGTTDKHIALENKLTKFHKTEDTILFPSCFDANAALFEGILTPEDSVFSDELNHASIIDGIRLSKATRYRFKHMDYDDLNDKLKESKSTIKLVVSDSVFSMDGDIIKLDKLINVCEKNNAILMLDECHASGVYGEYGGGITELYNAQNHVEIINSTLGKALGGGNGGFTTGKREIIDMLRQKARPYLFSNSLPSFIVDSYCKALDLITPQKLSKIKENVTAFRTGIKELGFDIRGDDNCAIVPIMIYDAKKCSEVADELLKEGIYVIGFSYPVVGKGLARIRVQISASHSREEIQNCLKAFEKIGKQYGII